MTYRNDHSYFRFPESVRTIPERSLRSASARMDELLPDGKQNHRLQDEPAATESQNVFAATEVED